MADRVCGGCGKAEVRKENGDVNLDPVTGYCVDCLIACAKEAKQPPPELRQFDARAAAANDVGDR